MRYPITRVPALVDKYSIMVVAVDAPFVSVTSCVSTTFVPVDTKSAISDNPVESSITIPPKLGIAGTIGSLEVKRMEDARPIEFTAKLLTVIFALLKFVIVPFVPTSVPTCAVKEEIELPMNLFKDAVAEDTLFAVMELTPTLDASNTPTCAVKEEMELPTYRLTEAEPVENCWAFRVVTFAFVPTKEPIWAVKEEMELPTYWFTRADPDDKFVTLTDGVLIALIAMLPVDNDNVFT